MSLDTMVGYEILYVVYFYVKKQFASKKSHQNCVQYHWYAYFIHQIIGKWYISINIITMDPLEAQEIKTILLSMYIWCTSIQFCAIYKKYNFCIQNPSIYKCGYIIPFAMSNNDWIGAVYMSWLINDDTLTYFVCQKLSYFSFVAFWFHCINLQFSGKHAKFIQVRSSLMCL